MLVLFDQGTPVPLRRYLTPHAVTTRHPSPTPLRNLFPAVCTDTFCPRSIAPIPTGQLNPRSRVKSVTFTRNPLSISGSRTSCFSRSMIHSFFFIIPPTYPSLGGSTTAALNFLPLPSWCSVIRRAGGCSATAPRPHWTGLQARAPLLLGPG